MAKGRGEDQAQGKGNRGDGGGRRPTGVSPGVWGGAAGMGQRWMAARKFRVVLRLFLDAPLPAGARNYAGTLEGLQSKSAEVASRPQPSQTYFRSSILPLQ